MSTTPANWSKSPPDSEGAWWFYGDMEYGIMGGNYNGSIPPEQKLRYVEVRLMANHLVGVCSGRFVQLIPFDADERSIGYVGVWQKVRLPTLPL